MDITSSFDIYDVNLAGLSTMCSQFEVDFLSNELMLVLDVIIDWQTQRR